MFSEVISYSSMYMIAVHCLFAAQQDESLPCLVSILAISMRWVLGANRDNLKDRQEFLSQNGNSVLLRKESSFYMYEMRNGVN